MKVSELFRRLSFGRLKNLAISAEGSGYIIESRQPEIIQATNEGLLRLFGRFDLKQKELLVEQVQGLKVYELKRPYAESAGSSEVYRYIKDLTPGYDPFCEDVIQVLEVWGPEGKLVINDKENPLSLFTPEPHKIQVPNPVHGQVLQVLYRARHTPLHDSHDGCADILCQEIELPFFLEEALTYFIGYKVYSDMNGQENIIKSQEFENHYNNICLDVEARDLVNQTWHTSHHKLDQRGFV